MLIINKNTKKINESVTKLLDIQHYGKSWTTEHEPDEFVDMLMHFIDGTFQGLNDNKNAYKREDYFVEIIDNDIKLMNRIKKIIDDEINK